MAALSYSAICSLDGYVADAGGRWDWAVPDAEVHAYVNEFERPVGTYLYGRRMYEVLKAWDDDALLGDDPPPEMKDYAALWRAADKVVFSTTLAGTSPPTARTRFEPSFDADAIRALLRGADRAVSIGGPTIAAEALRAGLVDELHLVVFPAIVGGGLRALPGDLRLDLSLVDERRFACGAVAVRYAVAR